MAKFILKRFLYALLLLLIASVLIFYGLRVAPGDVTGSIVSVDRHRAARERHQGAARAERAARDAVLHLHQERA